MVGFNNMDLKWMSFYLFIYFFWVELVSFASKEVDDNANTASTYINTSQHGLVLYEVDQHT